jgi:hypothetical protein
MLPLGSSSRRLLNQSIHSSGSVGDSYDNALAAVLG